MNGEQFPHRKSQILRQQKVIATEEFSECHRRIPPTIVETAATFSEFAEPTALKNYFDRNIFNRQKHCLLSLNTKCFLINKRLVLPFQITRHYQCIVISNCRWHCWWQIEKIKWKNWLLTIWRHISWLSAKEETKCMSSRLGTLRSSTEKLSDIM